MAELELVKLEPVQGTTYDAYLESALGVLGDRTKKRIAGGRAQFNLATFAELAGAIVSDPANLKQPFDKQVKYRYGAKAYVLERVFREYGWPISADAVIIAGVQKYNQDPKDGFIPLAPGSIDIEAGIKLEPWGHLELDVFGDLREPNKGFSKILQSKIGIVTEYGNGDSLELVIPVYTPGLWKQVKDKEFGRRAGITIVTPFITLWCEGLDINFLTELPHTASVKMLEAVKIARQVLRELGLG